MWKGGSVAERPAQHSISPAWLVSSVCSSRMFGPILIRVIRYHWRKAGVLLLASGLLLAPTDARYKPAVAAPEPVHSESLLGRLEIAATGMDFPVLACPAPGICWDPATGWPGTGKNAVFYGALSSLTAPLPFEPGIVLRFVPENGHSYEFSIVRASKIPIDDSRLRGYAAPTSGDVITLIDCQAAVGSDPADSCRQKGDETLVVRAEALAPAAPLQSQAMGAPAADSWSDISIALPGLLIGHLVFLSGLMFFAWRSPSSNRRDPLRAPGGIGRELPFLLIGAWSLLGLALTELGTNYSLHGELGVAGMGWLWGGAAFAAVLLIASFLIKRLQIESVRNILLLAAVLTSMGLVAIYYWEAKSDPTSHPLFFKQVGASAAGLLLCLAVAWVVARTRALSFFYLPTFSALVSLALAGLALVAVVASFSGQGPTMSVPALGRIILSPVLAIGTIIALAGALGRDLSRSAEPAKRIPWSSRLLWLGPGFAIVAMLLADMGMGLVLGAAVLLMITFARGLKVERLMLVGIGGLLAVLALSAVFDHVPAPLANAQARLEAWQDPEGYFQSSERTNQVSRAFRQIVDRRFEELVEPELEASGPYAPPAVAPAVGSDIDRVELELGYRLHLLARGDSEVAEGLVPELGSGDEGLLIIAEELWSGLGAYRLDGRENDLVALAGKAERAVAELREMDSALAEWERQRAATIVEEQGRTESGAESIRYAYLGVVETQDGNFQQRQSLLTLRSGRLIGTGLGLGEPERLPAATEDLALVLFGEALGFVGVAAIVVIAVRLVSIALRRVEEQQDYPAAILGCGLVALFGVHALVAIGGEIGLLPFTGVPLPFASRGGTSLVVHWILIGLLMGLSAGLASSDRTGGALPVSPKPLRTAATAIAFAFVATLFAIQLTGHSISPGAPWAQLPQESAQGADAVGAAETTASADSGGAILDRDGRLLAWADATSNGERYPDRELAQSLSHTLASLENSFGQDLRRSGEPPILSLLGGRFWAPGDGRSLVTTIDGEIQEALHGAFDQRLRSMGLNPETAKGAAVVLDAVTGEILALESRPTFDPEALWDRQAWAEEEAEERRLGVRNRLLNRAILGTYPPGSTFKVITAAAALESGLYTPESGVFDYSTLDPGSSWHQLALPDGPPVINSNHRRPSDGSSSLEEALAWSDNVAFAEVAMTLGPEAILEMAGRFGFEQQIHVEGLGTSFSSVDLGYGTDSPDRFVRATLAGLAHTGYGQGQLLATPLQMALVAAAVANDGVLMEPHVIKGWRTSNGETLLERTPQPLLPAVLSEHALRDLQKILWSSVSDGLAEDAGLNEANQHPGVAGKTGTAEWSQEGRSAHSWFIGYYPAEHPRIALAILVEEAGESHLASFIARDVFGAPSVNSYVQEMSQSGDHWVRSWAGGAVGDPE
jgi:cell division protein FtsW (lipid II flippase)